MSDDATAHWTQGRIYDVAEFVRGVTFSKGDSRSEESSGGVPVLRAGNLQDGRIVHEDMTFVDERFVSATQRLRIGDIVVAMSSGSVSVVGKAAPVSERELGFGFGAFCGVWRPRSLDVAPWLSRFFQSPHYRSAVRSAALGVNINNLRADHIGELSLGMPPPGEQCRIVAKLDALQSRSRRAKEALDAIPPLLERFRQSVLAAAFRGDLTADWRAKNPDVEPASELLERIRIERRRRWEEAELAKMQAKGKPPPDDRWKAKYEEPAPVDEAGLPDLPEGWCWASLDEVTTDARIGLVRSAAEQSQSAPHPYVRMQHYKLSGEWDLRDVTRIEASQGEAVEFELKQGDVLFNTRNSNELVGKVAIWPHERPGHLFNNNLMRLRFVASVHSQWAGSQMMSPSFRARLAGSRSATTSVAAIYGRDLFRQAFAVAPREEQLAAVAMVNGAAKALRTTRSAMEESRYRIDGFDLAILAKAFRGELVPQDPNDEPAEAMLARLKTPTATDPEPESSPSKSARPAKRPGRPRKP